jgi:hypothetical protein
MKKITDIVLLTFLFVFGSCSSAVEEKEDTLGGGQKIKQIIGMKKRVG